MFSQKASFIWERLIVTRSLALAGKGRHGNDKNAVVTPVGIPARSEHRHERRLPHDGGVKPRCQLLQAGGNLEKLQKRNDNQAETIKDLQKQLETKEAVVIKPKYDDDVVLGMVIDSKVKETKIEMLEDEVKMLRQMVFNMIKGGGAA